MSKMGISTLRSKWTQIFEAVGISSGVLDKYFRGVVSRIGGIDLQDMARKLLRLMPEVSQARPGSVLENMGHYAYRRRGEFHAWNPETIARLQLATRSGDYARFKEFTQLVDQREQRTFLRDFSAISQKYHPS